MILDIKDSMAMAIIENPNLLLINDRFNIPLGFREANIEEICKRYGVNSDFYLAIINTYNYESYYDISNLKRFSPLLIVDYLRKTHSYYINQALPKIKNGLNQLISSYSDGTNEIELINKFYKQYENELLTHIQDEEENVFPYIERLVSNQVLENVRSLHTFEKEHTNVDVKLNDLKSLIIRYIRPLYDKNFCYDFLIMIDRFEKDIINHARIEDNILITKAIALEKELKS